MKINKLFFAALLMFCVFGTATAQDAGKTKVRAVNESMEQLELTEEQELKLQEIRKGYTAKIKKVRMASNNENTLGLREALQDLQEEQQVEIRSVLTEEQLEIYNKMLAKRKASKSPVKKAGDTFD